MSFEGSLRTLWKNFDDDFDVQKRFSRPWEVKVRRINKRRNPCDRKRRDYCNVICYGRFYCSQSLKAMIAHLSERCRGILNEHRVFG